MKKYEQLRAKKLEMETLLQEIKKLEQDPEVLQTMEFENNLKELMDRHSVGRDDLVNLLGDENSGGGRRGGSRSNRQSRVYRNPHSGEKVVSKGGPNKTLKEWRDKYGKQEVEKWKQ